MKSGTKARLDRLAVVAIPTGCHQGGGWCAAVWHLRTEEDDASNPAPATICPACGRQRLVRELVVAGFDPQDI